MRTNEQKSSGNIVQTGEDAEYLVIYPQLLDSSGRI
jgi:hypothetical protein